MTAMEIVCKIVATVVVISIIVVGSLGIKSCLKEKLRQSNVNRAIRYKEYARYPNSGDRIELNGKEIVILKRYFWSTERRYEVRLPNGEITDVLGSEIIDKKPIVSDPNFTER